MFYALTPTASPRHHRLHQGYPARVLSALSFRPHFCVSTSWLFSCFVQIFRTNSFAQGARAGDLWLNFMIRLIVVKSRQSSVYVLFGITISHRVSVNNKGTLCPVPCTLVAQLYAPSWIRAKCRSCTYICSELVIITLS